MITSQGEVYAWGDNTGEKLGLYGSNVVPKPEIVETLNGTTVAAYGLGGIFAFAVSGPLQKSVARRASF